MSLTIDQVDGDVVFLFFILGKDLNTTSALSCNMLAVVQEGAKHEYQSMPRLTSSIYPEFINHQDTVMTDQ